MFNLGSNWQKKLLVNYSIKKYILMNVAQYVNVLLLSLAFQGYLISVNPPLAISWSRWSLLTPRLLCCQLNPNPFFAGSGPSPFPLAQSDPFGLCILLYPAAFQGWGHPIWPETEVLPLEMGAVEDEKGESWRSHCVTAFVAVFLVRSGNPSEVGMKLFGVGVYISKHSL